MTPRTPLLALAVLLYLPAASFAGDPKPPIKGPGCGGLTGEIVSGAVAETLVMAAANTADSRIVHLKQTPVEFALIYADMPYGNEEIAVVNNPTKEQVLAILAEKAGYWKVVSDSLQKEKEKTDKQIADSSKAGQDGVGVLILRSNRLAKLRDASDSIVADVAADKAKIEGGSESLQAVLDRKIALARKGAALVPRAKEKP